LILFLLDWVEEDFFQTHERKSTSQMPLPLFNGFIKMKSGRQSNRGACGGIVASHDRWSVELFVDLPVSIENKDRTRTTDVERSVS